jgi:hypothetical protein
MRKCLGLLLFEKAQSQNSQWPTPGSTTKLMALYPYGSPLPISVLKWEGQRRSNVQKYDFPHPGNLYIVTKPFGEGHMGRVLISLSLVNPYWIKPQAVTAFM